MKNLLMAAILMATLGACNDNSRDPNVNDRSTEDRRVDTSLNRPYDSLRKDTIRMDTANRPKGGVDSIRHKY
ncbi:MAG: hypothetical protein J7578_02375 [Chitinophagaceae bacterium]|nr:hypothetical protein [Chitinophagaceae bacterium]